MKLPNLINKKILHNEPNKVALKLFYVELRLEELLGEGLLQVLVTDGQDEQVLVGGLGGGLLAGGVQGAGVRVVPRGVEV